MIPEMVVPLLGPEVVAMVESMKGVNKTMFTIPRFHNKKISLVMIVVCDPGPNFVGRLGFK
jgi:hypothetical protein